MEAPASIATNPHRSMLVDIGIDYGNYTLVTKYTKNTIHACKPQVRTIQFLNGVPVTLVDKNDSAFTKERLLELTTEEFSAMAWRGETELRFFRERVPVLKVHARGRCIRLRVGDGRAERFNLAGAPAGGMSFFLADAA
eukprot:362795-Chlamydomonas_euryale.AAC.3